MESILVSACLLGVSCRYDGGDCRSSSVLALKEKYHLIPVCPEIYGGLTTPRDPAERVGEAVLSCRGSDVTKQYLQGAKAALMLAQTFGCKKAVLKAHSPSCGQSFIYDGSFSGVLTAGSGTAAQLLAENGISIFDETQTAFL